VHHHTFAPQRITGDTGYFTGCYGLLTGTVLATGTAWAWLAFALFGKLAPLALHPDAPCCSQNKPTHARLAKVAKVAKLAQTSIRSPYQTSLLNSASIISFPDSSPSPTLLSVLSPFSPPSTTILLSQLPAFFWLISFVNSKSPLAHPVPAPPIILISYRIAWSVNNTSYPLQQTIKTR
jgi:hypothetical protein